MRLSDMLAEIQMGVDAALQIFGLKKSDLGDKQIINSTYRQLALRHHPDKGGDTELMKKITVAKSVLDKAVGGVGGKSSFDWEAVGREYVELARVVNDMLSSTFKPNNFTEYFSKVYGEPFYWVENHRIPQPSDKNPHYAGFDGEFFNKDRSVVFLFHISANLTNVKHAGNSLGSSSNNISFGLMVTAYGVYNNKKLKVSQRNWSHTNRHSVLFEPSETFPPKVLEKFKTSAAGRKFTKKDMVLSLKTQLGGSWDGQWVKVPLGGNLSLYFQRNVMFKTAAWTPTVFVGYRSAKFGAYKTFPETEETLLKFKELYKIMKGVDDESEAVSKLNGWVAKLKNKI
jgi:hypothetical protein